jgi:hypothetical protein
MEVTMNYHLLKADGEWRLREEGTNKDLFATDTKADAIEKLSDYMDSREGNVVVHKADGAIQRHHSYYREEESGDDGGLSRRTWGIIGAVTATAVTLASLAYVFRDSIPTDRMRFR